MSNRVSAVMFDEIGLGQGFRYLTGAMQVGGGVLMLFRRTLTLGAAMLACTMVGAAVVDVAVVGQPVFMIIPLLLLIAVATTWATSVNRSR